jgi:hypothetical protein
LGRSSGDENDEEDAVVAGVALGGPVMVDDVDAVEARDGVCNMTDIVEGGEEGRDWGRGWGGEREKATVEGADRQRQSGRLRLLLRCLGQLESGASKETGSRTGMRMTRWGISGSIVRSVGRSVVGGRWSWCGSYDEARRKPVGVGERFGSTLMALGQSTYTEALWPVGLDDRREGKGRGRSRDQSGRRGRGFGDKGVSWRWWGP